MIYMRNMILLILSRIGNLSGWATFLISIILQMIILCILYPSKSLNVWKQRRQSILLKWYQTTMTAYMIRLSHSKLQDQARMFQLPVRYRCKPPQSLSILRRSRMLLSQKWLTMTCEEVIQEVQGCWMYPDSEKHDLLNTIYWNVQIMKWGSESKPPLSIYYSTHLVIVRLLYKYRRVLTIYRDPRGFFRLPQIPIPMSLHHYQTGRTRCQLERSNFLIPTIPEWYSPTHHPSWKNAIRKERIRRDMRTRRRTNNYTWITSWRTKYTTKRSMRNYYRRMRFMKLECRQHLTQLNNLKRIGLSHARSLYKEPDIEQRFKTRTLILIVTMLVLMITLVCVLDSFHVRSIRTANVIIVSELRT